jgi:hypothetical protein
MDISHAIKTAQGAVVDAGLPAELQQVAFGEVLRHLLNDRPQPIAPGAMQQDFADGLPEASGLARLAARVKVSETALADVFEINGDNVSLHVASTRIDSARSRATREIALLIAAARQASGADDSWTAVSHVRDALQQYNRYDTSNFSTYLRGAADAFNFRGKGTSLEIRLTKPGWEMAATLIVSLVGGK